MSFGMFPSCISPCTINTIYRILWKLDLTLFRLHNFKMFPYKPLVFDSSHWTQEAYENMFKILQKLFACSRIFFMSLYIFTLTNCFQFFLVFYCPIPLRFFIEKEKIGKTLFARIGGECALCLHFLHWLYIPRRL